MPHSTVQPSAKPQPKRGASTVLFLPCGSLAAYHDEPRTAADARRGKK